MESEKKTAIKVDGDEVKKDIVDIQPSKILEWALYVVGALCIIMGIYYYNNDLSYKDSPYKFYQEGYVGGDAYNFIISASRSTAIMVKSLIWMVLGCTSMVIGRTLNNKKLCK